jgi:hypothetical protein
MTTLLLAEHHANALFDPLTLCYQPSLLLPLWRVTCDHPETQNMSPD